MMKPAQLDEALTALGAILEDRGESYELVAIGGGALNLLGLVRRPTKDLDVVAHREGVELVRSNPLPKGLMRAVADVGGAYDLEYDWLNSVPSSLMHFGLPDGFMQRIHTKTYGPLTLHLASRNDQICLKLKAAADDHPAHTRHLADLMKLHPTAGEFAVGVEWVTTKVDPSEGFKYLLECTLRLLNDMASDV